MVYFNIFTLLFIQNQASLHTHCCGTLVLLVCDWGFSFMFFFLSYKFSSSLEYLFNQSVNCHAFFCKVKVKHNYMSLITNNLHQVALNYEHQDKKILQNGPISHHYLFRTNESL